MKLLITLLTLISLNLFSQVTQEWVTRYNGFGSNNDEAQAIAVDGSGNIYVTGQSSGNGIFDDYATIKYNSSGVQQWAARYNGPGNENDGANSIVVDASGNVYVAGYSTGNGTNLDYAVVKYNSSGVQQWAARYNGPGNQDDIATSISIDNTGNLYVTGLSIGSGTGYDYATIKYNPSGVLLWVVRYNGPVNGYDWAISMKVDGLGNVYVTGQSYSNMPNDYDIATVKYNSSGVMQWVARYNGPGYENDWPESIVVDASGNTYVIGQTISSTANDYVTIKYNTTGVQQWVSRYNGTTGNSIDLGSSIAVDGTGNVFVTGMSLGSGTSYDYATIKYNSSGDSVWVRRYNGPGNSSDQASSLTIDGLGNVYVTGYSALYEPITEIDYATVKYNASGDSVWVRRYNGPGNGEDRANSIVLDNSGNVYVSGKSRGNGTGLDFATIKYSQTIGIQTISTENPESFSLSQNYPNPFNPSTKIQFMIPLSRGVSEGRGVLSSIIIYNSLGQKITELFNQQLQPGTYEVEWNATNNPSGLYFYQLTAGDFTETKKMILLK